MNYRSIELDIPLDEAREIVNATVTGVRSKSQGTDIVYTTPGGYHIAVLTPITIRGGESGTRLKYRTAMVSSSAAHARRRARNIKSALSKYAVEMP